MSEARAGITGRPYLRVCAQEGLRHGDGASVGEDAAGVAAGMTGTGRWRKGVKQSTEDRR